jgi:hypothetical protein
MPIKLSVRPVTPLACASVAPVRPAAYRRRYADRTEGEVKPLRGAMISIGVAAGLSLSACGDPSDQSLLSRFGDHRAQFEALKRMSDEDSQSSTIDRVALFTEPLDTRPLSPPLVSQKRWNAYIRLFQEAGIESGLKRESGSNSSVRFVVSCSGLVTHGSCKGIIWSGEPLAPTYADLDSAPARQQILRDGIGYRHIEGPWYLYEERN